MRSPVLGAGQAKEKKGGRPTLGASSLAARHLEDEICSRILVPRQAGRRAHGQPWESKTVGGGGGGGAGRSAGPACLGSALLPC